jgi:hypothetical protein
MARHNILKKKFCWVATETAKGWRLAAVIGNAKYNLKGLVLIGREDVDALLNKGGVVFVHLKNSKTEPKKGKK